MFNREIQVYSALLVVALIVGWVTWKGEQSPKKPKSATDTVTVLDLKVDEIASAKLDSKEITTLVTYRGKDEDRWVWIERTERKERRIPATPALALTPAETPEEGASPTPTPEPEVEVVETNRAFTGGAAAIALMDRLAPLKASRKLGKVNDDAKEQFELVDPAMTLTVTNTKGKSFALKIGGEAPGGGSYYIMDNKEVVYLVSQSVVKPFTDTVTGLMQKSVHNMPEKDIAEIDVSSGGRNVVYEQRNRSSARDRFWTRKTDEKNPAKDEQFKTWLGKVRRLPIAQYPDPQPESDPPVKITLVYKDADGKEMGKLELAPGDGDRRPMVRTEKTRVWAEVNQTRADEVLSEVEAILGGSG